MNLFDNLVLVSGADYHKVKLALNNWLTLYEERLSEKALFYMYACENNITAIKTDPKLSNLLFYFLVNYLHYPEGIDYNVTVSGFTVGNENNQLNNKEQVVYVSNFDKEYDNVFVATKEGTYKVDFGGRMYEEKEEQPFYYPNNITLDNPEKIPLPKKVKGVKKIVQKKENSFGRMRFLWLFVMSYSLLILFLPITVENKTTAGLILPLVVYVWFFADYKMLQIKKQYLLSLFLSFVLFVFLLLFGKYILSTNMLFYSVGMLPFIFLLVQKPLRSLFIRYVKREPIVERPAPDIQDFIYVVALFCSSMYLTLMVNRYLL